ncbi:MAG: hypothetical protein KGL34_03870 [Gammaproteobacteria bacterium]|nr:hypothetical protein [Gammaproteobacteria bacterium]
MSLPTSDVRESLAFYRKLGFSFAEVGEAWPHPYAVATDGRISIGLHQCADLEPTLTFVRPDLLRHLEGLERLVASFDVRRLGPDVFNELRWRDPGGNSLRFVEARTFSPSTGTRTNRSLCGDFREVALPAADAAQSKSHWEAIGFVGLDEEGGLGRHVGCTSDTLDLGLYSEAELARPTLLFEVDDLAATGSALTAAGIRGVARRAGGAAECLSFTAPEGTPILVLGGA